MHTDHFLSITYINVSDTYNLNTHCVGHIQLSLLMEVGVGKGVQDAKVYVMALP